MPAFIRDVKGKKALIAKIKRNVLKLRTEAGITQTALGIRTGCTTATISQIEGGIQTPSLLLAIKLSRALGITLDELVA